MKKRNAVTDLIAAFAAKRAPLEAQVVKIEKQITALTRKEKAALDALGIRIDKAYAKFLARKTKEYTAAVAREKKKAARKS